MAIKMTAPLEVGIVCRDLPALRQFYENILGLTFISEVMVGADKARQAALSERGYTVVRLQTPYGERIKLLAPVDPPPVSEVPGYILDKANASYLTFIVDDIKAVVGRIAAAGIQFMTGSERIEVRPGTYLAFCRDPEGNVLEIVQYDDLASYRPDLQAQEA